jgi:hypothetical protein
VAAQLKAAVLARKMQHLDRASRSAAEQVPARPLRGTARRAEEEYMHDIGRTQLEHQPFGEPAAHEFEGGEFEGGEFEHGDHEGGEAEGGELEGYGEFEGGEFEGGELEGYGEFEGGEFEGGEFEGGEFEGELAEAGEHEEFAELESPLTEMQEMELASELLEVTSEQDLEQFLGDVFRAAGQAVGNFVRSDTGRALGGILSDSLRSVAKQALPVVGRALGDAAGGAGDLGERAGSAAGTLLGLELEGLSAEDREFETARQLVRFVGSAAGLASAAPRQMPPDRAAHMAARRAARVYVPGLLPRLQGRSTRLWPRGGRWVRRGRTIVLYGA